MVFLKGSVTESGLQTNRAAIESKLQDIRSQKGEGAKVVFLLENLRFYKGESGETPDPRFSEELADLGDGYVNDAFATAHRKDVSVYGVPKAMGRQGKPVMAGFLMEEEIEGLGMALDADGILIGGKKLDKGGILTAIESVKAATDVYSPITGEVIEFNGRLSSEPDLVNKSAEEDGWLVKIKIQNASELDELLTPEDYEKSHD